MSDFDLPKTNINRIIKNKLPDGLLVVQDARLAFSKAAVVFIMYLTAAAHENSVNHKRSTLMADDVLAAIESMNLPPEYKEKLEECLEAYRNKKSEKTKASTSSKRPKKTDEEAGSEGDTLKTTEADKTEEGEGEEVEEIEEEQGQDRPAEGEEREAQQEDLERPSKQAKREHQTEQNDSDAEMHATSGNGDE